MARRKKMPLWATGLAFIYAANKSTQKANYDKARARQIEANITDTQVRTKARIVDIKAKQAATQLKLAQAREAEAKAAYYEKMTALGKLIPEGEAPTGTKMLKCPQCNEHIVPTIGAKICDRCKVPLVPTTLDFTQTRH